MAKRASTRERNGGTKADGPISGYDRFKEYKGRRYTGVQVGRGHTWHYDPGLWKETKRTPDLWGIHFAVTKRRAGHAPKGSGVPVGTEYNWLIVAHQVVRKLNANDYSTELTGSKFKVAHKRADKGVWSVTEKGQRARMVRFLRDLADRLETESGDPIVPVPATVTPSVKAPTKAPVKAKAKARSLPKPVRAIRGTRPTRVARKADKVRA